MLKSCFNQLFSIVFIHLVEIEGNSIFIGKRIQKITSVIAEIVLIGHRKDIVISTGDLTSINDGLEVIVEEANGSKYMIPLNYDCNSNVFKGYNILLRFFSILSYIVCHFHAIACGAVCRLLDS